MHSYRGMRAAVHALSATRRTARPGAVQTMTDSSRGDRTARVAPGRGAPGARRGSGVCARLIVVLLAGLCAPLALSAPAHADGPCGATGVLSVQGTTNTCTYATAGLDTFAVPSGVSTLQVTAVGGAGGKGGDASAGVNWVGARAAAGPR